MGALERLAAKKKKESNRKLSIKIDNDLFDSIENLCRDNEINMDDYVCELLEIGHKKELKNYKNKGGKNE